MRRFQYGECMALIATDGAARGIDIEESIVLFITIHRRMLRPTNIEVEELQEAEPVELSCHWYKSRKRNHTEEFKKVGINVEFKPLNSGYEFSRIHAPKGGRVMEAEIGMTETEVIMVGEINVPRTLWWRWWRQKRRKPWRWKSKWRQRSK